jgi:CheY-like chemotaxis protein
MPNGGEINIYVTEATESEIKKFDLQLKKYLKIQICDNGVGIPFEIQNKIFTPYFTTKTKGTGLGLATAYSIIKRHMGYIGFDSIPNQGTTFTIYLPITYSIPQKDNILSKEETVSFSGNCLIMDDNEIILKSLENILVKMGFNVDTAINGIEAVMKYRSQFLKNTPYQMVVLDLIIPGSMGGKEAASEILKFDPNAKILISTGYSEDEIRTNFNKFGLKGVLIKPYTIDQMRHQIRVIFDNDSI